MRETRKDYQIIVGASEMGENNYIMYLKRTVEKTLRPSLIYRLL